MSCVVVCSIVSMVCSCSRFWRVLGKVTKRVIGDGAIFRGACVHAASPWLAGHAGIRPGGPDSPPRSGGSAPPTRRYASATLAYGTDRLINYSVDYRPARALSRPWVAGSPSVLISRCDTGRGGGPQRRFRWTDRVFPAQ